MLVYRFTYLLCLLTLMWQVSAGAQPGHKVSTQLLNPRVYPDDARRAVQPPSWETFGNKTQFVALRGFGVAEGKVAGYAEEMERYQNTFRLGNVIWPMANMIFTENLSEVADEIKRRGLFLFDLWGYVPGSGPGGWEQFHPDPKVFELLESKLGDHWLGMDIGEQDGRYIGGYAPQMYPISNDRVQQYLNFQRHFQRMTDELGNKNATLVSLNYGHYFLKEGVYTTIGAETAQGLPNGQIYYAFIRGAGKQYGVPWFGNASVWNRWGYKSYDGEGSDHGPTQGTSLSLLKRLLYSHILYNCVFVGFESGWIHGDGLSPIGKIQQSAVDWVEANGQPGVMQTPIGLLLDFYSGWTFPRHLYTDKVYRVWGNLPYEPGDFLTEGVLDMLYPGYQDSSFYHDESGFLSPTPYGDSADCLLTDAPLWVLEQYPMLLVAGGLRGGAELRDKLQAYVEQGGNLIITAGNLDALPGGLGGMEVSGPPVLQPARTSLKTESGALAETASFDLYSLHLPPEAKVRAECAGMPAVVDVSLGKGSITVLASTMGVPAQAAMAGPLKNEIDKPLDKPFPLLAHVRAELDQAFRSQALFEAGEGLSVITCRRGPGEYTLAIANNSLEARPIQIVSHCGPIHTSEELALDQSEKSAAGYLPTGQEGRDVGVTDSTMIAGGDVRVFRIGVTEQGVEELPAIEPPPRPQGRILPLGKAVNIQEALLARPTFFEHFDAVSVDWRYVQARDLEALRQESQWLARQGVRIWIDLTSGINLYPDIRLIDNDAPEYAASMQMLEGLLEKTASLGAHDLIFSLHRVPENNFTREETLAAFEKTLVSLCAKAAEKSITLYLRQSSKSESLDELEKLQQRVGASNLRLALSTALLLPSGKTLEAISAMNDRVGLWLASAPAPDFNTQPWTMQAPLITAAKQERLPALLAALPQQPILLDASYENAEDEYRDIALIEQWTRAR